MSIEAMMAIVMETVQQKLSAFCHEVDGDHLTPAVAEQVTQGLSDALAEAGREGLRCFLESHDNQQATCSVAGRVYRWKRVSPKEQPEESNVMRYYCNHAFRSRYCGSTS